jgi:hypothetical protein
MRLLNLLYVAKCVAVCLLSCTQQRTDCASNLAATCFPYALPPAAAEFELLGQQQEVATKLEAAQQQLDDAQARAEAATAEGSSAREQLSQVRVDCGNLGCS